ncbi:anaerobic C4-dicarboxylate transporter [Cellulomonas triticagri]|uniref:C4-dicarboxylate transporter DcuA n=1 Tax=Cellulomonas triticagri TaxID=2483352 RepID=A0A3M2JK83_9CELL|nr:anaerobic C4-dicarboxylate transporter [Cellulomonas triticagri]RMI14232.1 anaerobic C4-dicarboxylate transporter [Cellulomonas triticagri]
MIWLHLLVVLGAILLGARLGGIAIGYAGGLGVLALAVLGVTPGDMPLDVVSIIMAVIAAIAAMQVAGGMDWLVDVAARLLRRNPRHLTFLAPVVTFLMTVMAGTGHTAFSTLPVIAEVAKENDLRPARPLSIAVVASQIAITASPISAAVLFFSGLLEESGTGVDYLGLLAVAIPSTFLACLATAAVLTVVDRARGRTRLSDDPEYQRRLAAGTVVPPRPAGQAREVRPGARLSVAVFGVGLLAVMAYATLISEKAGVITDPVMGRDQAIIAIMLSVAAVIVLTCRVEPAQVLTASTFRSGTSACLCVLGVAWLGLTFFAAHEDAIQHAAGDVLAGQPWLLAVALVLASALMYSQASTARALMPTALAMGVAAPAAVAAFPAVSALFVLPTYPTLLAAVEMDDTGTTRIGKYVFDHPFLAPGMIAITLSVAFGFAIGAVVL